VSSVIVGAPRSSAAAIVVGKELHAQLLPLLTRERIQDLVRNLLHSSSISMARALVGLARGVILRALSGLLKSCKLAFVDDVLDLYVRLMGHVKLALNAVTLLG
jgi:hypothetical protein